MAALLSRVMSEIKYTLKRLHALQYAARDKEVTWQPSYGVARPLEKAGLIVWTAPKGVDRVRQHFDKRGWRITKTGEAILNAWRSVKDAHVVEG